MIRTLMHVNWINLKRDRVALGLTFVLPVIFFSIFAFIFGGMNTGGGGSGSIHVIVVDEDATEISNRFAETIDQQDALRVVNAPLATEKNPQPTPYDRETARQAVRAGDYSVAVIIPKGFSKTFGKFTGDRSEVELIYDAANPIALNTTAGLLQAASFMTAPDILMESGLDQLELAGGFLTDKQREILELAKQRLRNSSPVEAGDGAGDSGSFLGNFQGFIAINTIEAREGDDPDEGGSFSIITYYAAAIGVMFLLFSMAGASGAILEDEDRGTLERLLNTRLSMGKLLLGHWIFFALVGGLQLVIMFLWAEIAFGIDFFTVKHIAGFLLLTIFTSAAAAAFGLFLATICKSRAQLSGISTIFILIMSALGGSMIPRMVAPFLETTSKFTFNGWALDGYQKIFWNDIPSHTLLESLFYLWPQLALLAGMTVLLLVISRQFARRWESI